MGIEARYSSLSLGEKQENAALTTPLGIRLTWATIHNLKNNRGRIARLVGGVKTTVIIGTDQLKALAAREIVILLFTNR
jgi:hypothetical protein